MKPLPLGRKLVLWYFCLLALCLLAFAAFTLATLHHAVHRTLDRELAAHLSAVREIVQEDAAQPPSVLQNDLDEDVELAPSLTLLALWNQNGQPLYRSATLDRFRVPAAPPAVTHHPITRVFGEDRELRVLVQNVSTPAGSIRVLAAMPIHDFAEAEDRVAGSFWIAIPLLLVLITLGGLWIAARALAPVRNLIATADAIHPGDLSARLAVPPAADELQRLAITLNRMLARLEAGFARITRFTADASHELRTPIALVRARTEILLRRPRAVEEYRAAHQANLAELERTSVLIENLLLLARTDAGAETLRFAPVDLTTLVRAACEEAKSLAAGKQLTCSAEIPTAPLLVSGDEAALRRLLLILLDNAIKYTPEQGTIEISLHSSGSTAVVEARDSGPGIPPESLPCIFDRFYRAEPSRTTPGAGLGLSIARWIAERHAGALTAENTEPAGALFRLTLPIHSAVAHTSRPSA